MKRKKDLKKSAFYKKSIVNMFSDQQNKKHLCSKFIYLPLLF